MPPLAKTTYALSFAKGIAQTVQPDEQVLSNSSMMTAFFVALALCLPVLPPRGQCPMRGARRGILAEQDGRKTLRTSSLLLLRS